MRSCMACDCVIVLVHFRLMCCAVDSLHALGLRVCVSLRLDGYWLMCLCSGFAIVWFTVLALCVVLCVKCFCLFRVCELLFMCMLASGGVLFLRVDNVVMFCDFRCLLLSPSLWFVLSAYSMLLTCYLLVGCY